MTGLLDAFSVLSRVPPPAKPQYLKSLLPETGRSFPDITPAVMSELYPDTTPQHTGHPLPQIDPMKSTAGQQPDIKPLTHTGGVGLQMPALRHTGGAQPDIEPLKHTGGVMPDLREKPYRTLYVGEGSKGWGDLPNKFSMLTDKKPRAEISDEGMKIKDNFFDIASSKSNLWGSKVWELIKRNPGKSLSDLGKEGNAEALELLEAHKDPLSFNKFKLGDVVEHEQLYKNYPDIKDMNVVFFENEYEGGHYNPSTNTIQISQNEGKDKQKSTFLHEIQHAIQEKEGFAMGGSPTQTKPEMVEDDLNALFDAANLRAYMEQKGVGVGQAKEWYQTNFGREPHKYAGQFARTETTDSIVNLINEQKQRLSETQDPYKHYQRLAGEVEARDVSSRANLSDAERVKQMPLSSQGIPLKDMIVKKEGGTSASVEKPLTAQGAVKQTAPAEGGSAQPPAPKKLIGLATIGQKKARKVK